MKKSTKRILVGSAIVLSGVALYIALNSGQKIEDVGEVPDLGIDLGENEEPLSPEETLALNEQENTNTIQVGDFLTPFGQYANVRTSMEVNNGFWWNNLYITGDLAGVVYNGNIIGKVTEINFVGGHTWYKIALCAIVNGVYDTVSNVIQEMAQDTCSPALQGYIRSDVVIKVVYSS